MPRVAVACGNEASNFENRSWMFCIKTPSEEDIYEARKMHSGSRFSDGRNRQESQGGECVPVNTRQQGHMGQVHALSALAWTGEHLARSFLPHIKDFGQSGNLLRNQAANLSACFDTTPTPTHAATT